jgi:hypothetical protein
MIACGVGMGVLLSIAIVGNQQLGTGIDNFVFVVIDTGKKRKR